MTSVKVVMRYLLLSVGKKNPGDDLFPAPGTWSALHPSQHLLSELQFTPGLLSLLSLLIEKFPLKQHNDNTEHGHCYVRNGELNAAERGAGVLELKMFMFRLQAMSWGIFSRILLFSYSTVKRVVEQSCVNSVESLVKVTQFLFVNRIIHTQISKGNFYWLSMNGSVYWICQWRSDINNNNFSVLS